MKTYNPCEIADALNNDAIFFESDFVLATDAIKEIERLRADIENLCAENKSLREDREQLRAEIKHLITHWPSSQK
jgi:cell division protein FtsB